MKFEYRGKGKCPSVNPGQCKAKPTGDEKKDKEKCPSALTKDDRTWSTCYGHNVDVSLTAGKAPPRRVIRY